MSVVFELCFASDDPNALEELLGCMRRAQERGERVDVMLSHCEVDQIEDVLHEYDDEDVTAAKLVWLTNGKADVGRPSVI